MESTGNDRFFPNAAFRPEILYRLFCTMKSNVALLCRVSSVTPCAMPGGSAGSSPPLCCTPSRAIAGRTGRRNEGGVAVVGNCGLDLNVSVSLAQVSKVELLPPALVLAWMKSCQATWSGAFIAGFGCDCAAAGRLGSRNRPETSAVLIDLLIVALHSGFRVGIRPPSSSNKCPATPATICGRVA